MSYIERGPLGNEFQFDWISNPVVYTAVEITHLQLTFRVCSACKLAGEDLPPMQLKEGVFRCIWQLYDCLLTEVHERCKKGLTLAKRLNSSLAFFCYDLLSVIEPRQVFELVSCDA